MLVFDNDSHLTGHDCMLRDTLRPFVISPGQRVPLATGVIEVFASHDEMPSVVPQFSRNGEILSTSDRANLVTLKTGMFPDSLRSLAVMNGFRIAGNLQSDGASVGWSKTSFPTASTKQPFTIRAVLSVAPGSKVVDSILEGATAPSSLARAPSKSHRFGPVPQEDCCGSRAAIA